MRCPIKAKLMLFRGDSFFFHCSPICYQRQTMKMHSKCCMCLCMKIAAENEKPVNPVLPKNVRRVNPKMKQKKQIKQERIKSQQN